LKAARDHLLTQISDSDRVMILAYKKGLRLVQDFTSDRALLASRMDELKADSTTIDLDVLDEGRNLSEVASKSCDADSNLCANRKSAAMAFAAQEEQRARRSLEALERLMPALAGLKGRKALVLFTDALREEPGVQYASLARTTPQAIGVSIATDLLRLTREANAAGVSIYTVHASGLDDHSVDQFRDTRTQEVPKFRSAGDRPDSDADSLRAAESSLDSALAIQTTLAAETGGRSLKRTNDLAGILETAQTDLSCYYLLGYRTQSRANDERHSLIVRVRSEDGDGPRRGLTIRHRPYYYDDSPEDRRERLLRSALEAPELYRALPVQAEAFNLAPDKTGRRVLIKASVPLESISLVPAGDGSGGSHLTGEAIVQGEVSLGSRVLCEFESTIPLRLAREGNRPRRLVFETGCVLEPGTYQLVLIVLDPATQEAGARRTPLIVQSQSGENATFLSDLYLWARDSEALLVTEGAEDIGMKSSTGSTGYIPLSERRLRRGQPGMLSFLLCPPAGGNPSMEHPIQVNRTLTGDAEVMVADFKDLVISEPPDLQTGCYQIMSNIPGDTLGDGVYSFTVKAREPSSGSIVTRSFNLAVE
ncbi:MAG TPA: VWA domain-containing protein, partial [Candidatus Polarisedimenticolia bacterium]|nr:VWA domain-containing protein [Candidatus Polarisedimenticolia bacterium]